MVFHGGGELTANHIGTDSINPTVRFGLFDWIDSNGMQIADLYEERLKYLEFADQAGFYGYHLAEHHATPLSMATSPGLFLAAAAQRTRRIRLGPLVYLLPLYNPLRLTQEICMLDHLSQGRMELGVGRGVSPYELGFFNVDREGSRTMFQEALSTILPGLEGGQVSVHGEHFSINDVQVHMRPFQRPYPPLWYPTDNPDSIRWLAQEGINTVTHYAPINVVKELFDLYKSEWQEHRNKEGRLNGHEPDPKLGIVRHVYVADTDERALSEAKSGFAGFIHNFNYLRTAHGDTSGRADYLADFEGRMADGLHIVGSPASVLAQVKDQVEATGSNYFVGSFFFGSLTFEQTMESMRLFAEKVMPNFGPAS